MDTTKECRGTSPCWELIAQLQKSALALLLNTGTSSISYEVKKVHISEHSMPRSAWGDSPKDSASYPAGRPSQSSPAARLILAINSTKCSWAQKLASRNCGKPSESPEPEVLIISWTNHIRNPCCDGYTPGNHRSLAHSQAAPHCLLGHTGSCLPSVVLLQQGGWRRPNFIWYILALWAWKKAFQ